MTVPAFKGIKLDFETSMTSWLPELPSRTNVPTGMPPTFAVAVTAGLNVPAGPKTAASSTSMTGEPAA